MPVLKMRQVTIYDLRVIDSIDEQTTRFQVKCGGGTYVRSLARDLAVSLGTYGYVSNLRRLQDGLFGVQDTISLEKAFEIGHKSGDHSLIRPIETVLDDIPAVLVSANDAQRIRQGLDIDGSDVQGCFDEGAINGRAVALLFENRLLAMANFEERRLRPRRVFNLTT